ncbi:MAG: extracellular solute-binding protein [Silicimonas sp.]|nr:extracellular solute-binding protein [Silicimonas sp.]
MRLTCLTVALVWLCFSAHAFEIEEQVLYEASPQGSLLTIISTADRDVFEPIILAFQKQNQTISVDYTITGTTELMKAISEEKAQFDLVISSAMDLQTKLANDGFARSYSSPATQALPDWAKWRDQLFAFTQEPAVLIVSKKAFPDGNIPTSRGDLIALLRDAPERFRGRIGTYDVRTSGFGYLMATQDARISETFWRLLEAMGRLEAKLYCCSGDMLRDVREGKLALAYNVLGSYAEAQASPNDGVEIVVMRDFANIMLRTALITNSAQNAQDAETMIDFLTRLRQRDDLVKASGLPPIDNVALQDDIALRPIRLGPGLLVFLDRLKRDSFLRNWEASITQD